MTYVLAYFAGWVVFPWLFGLIFPPRNQADRYCAAILGGFWPIVAVPLAIYVLAVTLPERRALRRLMCPVQRKRGKNA